MYLKPIIIALFFAFLISFETAAQNNSMDMIGTFQMMTSNPKLNQVFTTDLYELINNERLQDSNITVQLSSTCWVMILSATEIESGDFIPLPDEWVLYEPENGNERE